MRRRLQPVVGLTLALAVPTLGSCAVVNRDHLDGLETGQVDSGTPDTGPPDSGPVSIANDSCGGDPAEYLVLRESTPEPLLVDTTLLTDRVRSCDTTATPGHDGFIAVEVQALDQWHFHLQALEMDRNPILYMLFAPAGSCDSRACDYISNSCEFNGDEHFAFIAPEDGIWYLGIDDGEIGGGQYRLEAVKLRCDGVAKQHGEGCDGSTNCDPVTCREVLTEGNASERLPNDNAIEGNQIEFPPSGQITVRGAIGDVNYFCHYPDVYYFVVQNDLTDLQIQFLRDDGTACTDPATTPFGVTLRNLAGEIINGGMTNPTTGCTQLVANDLAAAAYFIYVQNTELLSDRAYIYNMNVSLSL